MIVIGVEMFRKELEKGEVGDNVGVFLRGIKKEEVERGMVLCKLGFIILYKKFEGEIYVFFKEEGGRYILFFINYCL